jgi:glycerol-3-phosphate dehydrogenase
MNIFSSENRQVLIDKVKDESFDLLVIGGGITGAGIILDAQARGLKTVLFEMQDFAAGTSSRSTKLIHGGLRYLKQFELRLVAEVGRERAIVYENAPHVTRPEPMLLPLIKGGAIGSLGAFIGMWIYDLLAGVKKHERRKLLNKEEALEKEPLLNKDILIGGAYYYEYRTDDARLTIEIIKEAVSRESIALNYCKVTGFLYKDKKITGVKVKDLLRGQEFEVYAKKVVNAAGPWVDQVIKIDDPQKEEKLFVTKGVHIVVDYKKFPVKQSVYFDAGKGRMIFAIPREGKTYIGTTDTEYKGDLINPEISREDKLYLIYAVNSSFPKTALALDDIESSWAGLRPLIKEEGKLPSAISRKDEIFMNPSGLITIAGGKLTGYRKMAKRITDLIVEYLLNEEKKKYPEGATHKITLSGGKFGGAKNYKSFVEENLWQGVKLGLKKEEARMLAEIYGSNVSDLFKIIAGRREEANQFNISLPLFARLVYAIENEMTFTPSDFFVRRTGFLYFNIQEVIHWKDAVIQYMSQRFRWSKEEENKHRQVLENEIKVAGGKFV